MKNWTVTLIILFYGSFLAAQEPGWYYTHETGEPGQEEPIKSLKISLMMKILISPLILVLLFSCSAGDSETWHIDNLESIGGHEVTVVGDPEVVETDIGQAVRFDGDGDLLLVDNNPVGNANTFTVGDIQAGSLLS